MKTKQRVSFFFVSHPFFSLLFYKSHMDTFGIWLGVYNYKGFKNVIFFFVLFVCVAIF